MGKKPAEKPKIQSNPEWDEKSVYEKRLSIIGLVLSFTILILVVMQALDIFPNAILVFVPLTGLLMLVKAIELRGSRKVASFLCILAASFLFFCSIIFVL